MQANENDINSTNTRGSRSAIRSSYKPSIAPAPDHYGTITIISKKTNGLGSVYHIEDDIIYLGSDPECHIRINNSGVAKRHAKIEVDLRNLVLTDLTGSKGVLRNGKAITTDVKLTDGDKITIADRSFLIGCPPVPYKVLPNKERKQTLGPRILRSMTTETKRRHSVSKSLLIHVPAEEEEGSPEINRNKKEAASKPAGERTQETKRLSQVTYLQLPKETEQLVADRQLALQKDLHRASTPAKSAIKTEPSSERSKRKSVAFVLPSLLEEGDEPAATTSECLPEDDIEACHSAESAAEPERIPDEGTQDSANQEEEEEEKDSSRSVDLDDPMEDKENIPPTSPPHSPALLELSGHLFTEPMMPLREIPVPSPELEPDRSLAEDVPAGTESLSESIEAVAPATEKPKRLAKRRSSMGGSQTPMRRDLAMKRRERLQPSALASVSQRTGDLVEADPKGRIGRKKALVTEQTGVDVITDEGSMREEQDEQEIAVPVDSVQMPSELEAAEDLGLTYDAEDAVRVEAPQSPFTPSGRRKAKRRSTFQPLEEDLNMEAVAVMDIQAAEQNGRNEETQPLTQDLEATGEGEVPKEEQNDRELLQDVPEESSAASTSITAAQVATGENSRENVKPTPNRKGSIVEKPATPRTTPLKKTANPSQSRTTPLLDKVGKRMHQAMTPAPAAATRPKLRPAVKEGPASASRPSLRATAPRRKVLQASTREVRSQRRAMATATTTTLVPTAATEVATSGGMTIDTEVRDPHMGGEKATKCDPSLVPITPVATSASGVKRKRMDTLTRGEIVEKAKGMSESRTEKVAKSAVRGALPRLSTPVRAELKEKVGLRDSRKPTATSRKLETPMRKQIQHTALSMSKRKEEKDRVQEAERQAKEAERLAESNRLEAQRQAQEEQERLEREAHEKAERERLEQEETERREEEERRERTERIVKEIEDARLEHEEAERREREETERREREEHERLMEENRIREAEQDPVDESTSAEVSEHTSLETVSPEVHTCVLPVAVVEEHASPAKPPKRRAVKRKATTRSGRRPDLESLSPPPQKAPAQGKRKRKAEAAASAAEEKETDEIDESSTKRGRYESPAPTVEIPDDTSKDHQVVVPSSPIKEGMTDEQAPLPPALMQFEEETKQPEEEEEGHGEAIQVTTQQVKRTAKRRVAIRRKAKRTAPAAISKSLPTEQEPQERNEEESAEKEKEAETTDKKEPLEEEAPEEVSQKTVPGQEVSEDTIVDGRRIGDMVCTQLKTALKKRGLPTGGLKAALVARLVEACKAEASPLDAGGVAEEAKTESNEKEEERDEANQEEKEADTEVPAPRKRGRPAKRRRPEPSTEEEEHEEPVQNKRVTRRAVRSKKDNQEEEENRQKKRPRRVARK